MRRTEADLVVDEDEDDVRLRPRRPRLVVGDVPVVGLGLHSRQEVQAAEEAPQQRSGGSRRLHVGPRNPAENNNQRQQRREVGHQQGKMSRVSTNPRRRAVREGL